jgi:hypothetical protein
MVKALCQGLSAFPGIVNRLWPSLEDERQTTDLLLSGFEAKFLHAFKDSYEYDFGDGWIHRLELTGNLPMPANAPRARLQDGARRAPLEDSGGIGGYHDLLDALADPGHEEHEDLQAWVTWTAGPWQEFDPEQLDINAVNNELTLLFPAPSANEHGPEPNH